MLTSEMLDDSMCVPNALIDAMAHLGVSLSPQDRETIYRQRRQDIVFLAEESSPGGSLVELYNDPRKLAAYELERMQYIANPFDCIVIAATLWDIDEILANTDPGQRVLVKVKKKTPITSSTCAGKAERAA